MLVYIEYILRMFHTLQLECCFIVSKLKLKYRLKFQTLWISVPLVCSRWTSVNESVAPICLLRLRRNYHCGWKSQLFFVCTARDKMDGSNSLRIPLLSALQKVVSYILVAQSQWPCSLRHGYAAAHLLGLWFQIPSMGMNVCLLWVLYVVRYRSLHWVDHSSREVLSSVMPR